MPKDLSAAETWLRRAASKGHVGGMSAMANLLISDAHPDFASAAIYWREAADLGHAPSQYRAATVRNIDAWYNAFNVQRGQSLYLAPGERVRVW